MLPLTTCLESWQICVTLQSIVPRVQIYVTCFSKSLRYAIDSSKVEKELGWERTYTFEKGIKETIDWYLNNEEWLNAIKDGSYKNSYMD